MGCDLGDFCVAQSNRVVNDQGIIDVADRSQTPPFLAEPSKSWSDRKSIAQTSFGAFRRFTVISKLRRDGAFWTFVPDLQTSSIPMPAIHLLQDKGNLVLAKSGRCYRSSSYRLPGPHYENFLDSIRGPVSWKQVNGGPGGTRTPNQTVMSRRL